MDAKQIIEKIQAETGGDDNQAVLSALEDGQALAVLGITDADLDAVEEAHSFFKQKIKKIQ